MKNMLLDVHHHGSPRTNALNAVLFPDHLPEGEFLFSVGFHPWSTAELDFDGKQLKQTLADRRVVAVGETGIDKNQGADIEIQKDIFCQHCEMAMELSMPLIIHCVRASDLILQLLLHKAVSTPVVFHGFRGKPELARELVRSGYYVSFGEKFNEEAVRAVPSNLLLAETDESSHSIEEIIAKIAKARNEEVETTSQTISQNISRILNLRL